MIVIRHRNSLIYYNNDFIVPDLKGVDADGEKCYEN